MEKKRVFNKNILWKKTKSIENKLKTLVYLESTYFAETKNFLLKVKCWFLNLYRDCIEKQP